MNYSVTRTHRIQREQREELMALLKKYGQVWEPWQNELGTFKNGG
jgi:2-oxoisovalerate dehydrogenase E1 component alpha subunit